MTDRMCRIGRIDVIEMIDRIDSMRVDYRMEMVSMIDRMFVID